ncbi:MULTISPECIES: S-layer homology domain-containing protein [Veillonella]|uniref:S-layer homology domain-containing protein n=1 Tax=Veillonella TaxID=29465 RepID=UPI001D05D186|nr:MULTISPECIES: S-layer homology domain-containing protein [Veillonella]MBS6122412.1 S-layer homology domain-containing protein [Veillonella sp.]MCB6515950.1 S-layer homology domain-containing protein [Veillonella atypica]MCG4863603.1 S-layer homology domain-containing protein [Veillonella atypica]MDU6632613.1 S-layer homology domain-containing protein [Veillonella sp.]
MNKRKRLLAILINGMLLSSLCVASAADVTVGAGNGVAYGTGSSANNTQDIAVGNKAKVENYVGQNGSVAIGANAHVENMAGGAEAAVGMGQTSYSGSFWSSARVPADPSKVVGSVAIGNNTFARTGSTMIGSHNYRGAIGDTTIDTDNNGTRGASLNVYATTVGANSFSNGAFTTTTGTYNVISSSYIGGRFSTPTQNFGATVNGAFNSIESTSGGSTAGVATAITGVANRVANSNGALVYGAGNEITNSSASFSTPGEGATSAKDFADKLKTAVTSSNGAGATMAFGGGNKADYTLRTSLIGVNNTVTGVRGDQSKDNLALGVGNTGTKVQHMTVIGSKNTVSDAKNTVIVGDNRTVTGANNTVIIGSSDNGTTTAVHDAVAIGHNTDVSTEGGVALGSGSKATVAAGAVGYDILTNAPSTDTSATWKSTASAVSVGDVANGVTRQITSVAAGTNDTDAVNVAQLKRLHDMISVNTYNTVNVQGDVTNLKKDVSRLDKRVNKAVAGSAALAALHPLDFDPDAKWDFAAGYGHYHNGNAAALGAFYRPNEDVQLSVGSTVGNGETVVNAGLSVKVGAHSNVSRSRVAIGKEVLELKKTVALQNAQIQKLTALLNDVAGTHMKADRTTLFPDVASNHWAYEAVSDLSRRGLVEGYPDGTFGGDRLLTRYEFAQIVYRALQNGVQVDEQLVTEFSPEMALFRVDTVAKNSQGQPTIERVRLNKK